MFFSSFFFSIRNVEDKKHSHVLKERAATTVFFFFMCVCFIESDSAGDVFFRFLFSSFFLSFCCFAVRADFRFFFYCKT